MLCGMWQVALVEMATACGKYWIMYLVAIWGFEI